MREEAKNRLDDPRCDKILTTGQTIKHRIFVLSTFIILFIGIAAVALVAEQRQAALDRASGHSANLSAAFEEQVRRVMDSVSGAMELIVQRVEKEGPDFDLAQWAPLMPGVAASTVQLSIIGPDGMLVAASPSKNPKPVDLSDREHFRVHRDNPNLGLFVGKPVLGRVSQQVTIQVTRRLQAPDGSFGGVLVFSLNPDYLTSLHRQVDLGQTGNVTVAGNDSVIRARFTSNDRAETVGVGSSLAAGRSFKDSALADTGSHRSVQAQADNKQIDLSVHLPSRPLSIIGDEVRLTQIAINLLSNAVKFTTANGRVSIAAELNENAGVCITVSDTGIGMSADEIECALEHFRQVDNSFTKRFEGTGLGLPLARQFTKLHGGSVSIESVPGEGTTVFVRLPAERVMLFPVERNPAKPRDGVRKCGRAADQDNDSLALQMITEVAC